VEVEEVAVVERPPQRVGLPWVCWAAAGRAVLLLLQRLLLQQQQQDRQLLQAEQQQQLLLRRPVPQALESWQGPQQRLLGRLSLTNRLHVPHHSLGLPLLAHVLLVLLLLVLLLLEVRTGCL
jgi:hypothetical protein